MSGGFFLDRRTLDEVAGKGMKLVTASSCLLVLAVTSTLLVKAAPLLREISLMELLLSSSWAPMKGEFGLYPFIAGTLIVTGLALIIAVPICILCAIYISEYASRRTRSVIKPLIDLLAGIPSVLYGMWGVAFVVPLVRDWLGPLVGVHSSGYCVLSGSVVLAIMVFPIIISVSEEVMKAVPFEIRETSYALGATKWQTVKHTVMRSAYTGVLAAIILGFSRAFGETMAVIMVVGNVVKVPTSFFDSAYPLPALIANNYGEMMTLPLYDSALMLAALILLLVVGSFTVLARIIQKGIMVKHR